MHGRVALITGGSRGIGFGIARALALEGWDLAINGQRSGDEVSAAISELQGLGATAEYIQGDIGSPDGRSHLVAELRSRLGRIDALVNNAGVAPDVRSDILDAGEESFDRLIRTNLKGPYFLTQAIARMMLEDGQPDSPPRSIVFVTSVSATVASVNRGDYCITKAGLTMAAKLWAARLADAGINVYEVRPGIVSTDMTSGIRDKYDALIDGDLLLQKRWGTPDDVGRAVASLLRGDFAYSTGGVFMADGGMTVDRL